MFGEKALSPLPEKEMEPESAWEKVPHEQLLVDSISQELSGHIMLPPKENPRGDLQAIGDQRRCFLHRKPFAMGALRYAYHLWWKAMSRGIEKTWHLVVKESKFAISEECPQQVLSFFLSNHRRAQGLAAEFNLKLKEEVGEAESQVDFVPAYVFQLSDASKKSGFRYVTAEKYIAGAYTKLNSNDGWVNPLAEGTAVARVAAAFSHFSYDTTDGDELCVDVQGCGLKWTDPQLHSRAREFGPGDLAANGMKLFFRSHRCTDLCRALRLRQVDPETLALGKGLEPLPKAASASSSSAPAASSSSSSSSKVAALRPEEEMPKQQPAECLVCLDGKRSVLCRPCGHFCLCTECAQDLKNLEKNSRLCPVCRQFVDQFQPVGHRASAVHHSTFYDKKYRPS